MSDRFDPEKNPPACLPTDASAVSCDRCGTSYPIGQMRWDHRRGLWVCAHWPDCEGAGFHCDLHDATLSEVRMDSPPQNLIALKEAARLLPLRRGKRIHYSTIYRWATKGARGRKLETTRVGGVLYTTAEALAVFVGTRPPHDAAAQSEALRGFLYGQPRRDA